MRDVPLHVKQRAALCVAVEIGGRRPGDGNRQAPTAVCPGGAYGRGGMLPPTPAPSNS